MGHSCACGHDHAEEKKHDNSNDCVCGHDHGKHAAMISPADRKKLEEEITQAGFAVKEDADGNIVVAKKAE